jgi:ADP-ribosylglycohydrolase
MAGLTIFDRVWGGLLGGAVGDALGMPTECLHWRDIDAIFGPFGRFEDITPAMMAEVNARRRWKVDPAAVGRVTDDTVLADLLLDAILESDGRMAAHVFARAWEAFDRPVAGPGGESVNRLDRVHWIERIPFYRNRLRDIPKRELGHGEANATNAIMYIAPVGLLCAGDPLKAELMAVDVTSVNQHGRPRDVAGGYAAALAACFLPQADAEAIVRTALEHTRDQRHTGQMQAMVDLARTCQTCRDFIRRYYDEILGRVLPFQDWQHEGSPSCTSWNSAEVLGPALGALVITRGEDAREMILACARLGRDADTIARVAGGLIGAYRGAGAIPKEWADFVLARNPWLRLQEKARRLADLVERNLRGEVASRRAVLGD